MTVESAKALKGKNIQILNFGYDHQDTTDEFVNDDGQEVDYDFIERKFGEATVENAQKFFEEQAKNDEEDWKNKEGWELVDEGCKPFYTR